MDETDPLDCLKISLCRVLPAGLASRLRSRIDVCGPRHRGRAAVTAATVQPAHTDPDATCDTSPADDHPKPSQCPQEGHPSTFNLEANGSLDSAERACARVPQDSAFCFPAVFSDSDAAFQRSNPRGTPTEPVVSIQHPCPPQRPETAYQPTENKQIDHAESAV